MQAEQTLSTRNTHPSRGLEAIFEPRSVAVVGATESVGSVGRAVLENLMAGPLAGRVYPVHAKRARVLGLQPYASIERVPDPVDLAVIATPAATVPGVIDQCGAAGVRGAVVLSAGFREVGAEGEALEQRVREAARR